MPAPHPSVIIPDARDRTRSRDRPFDQRLELRLQRALEVLLHRVDVRQLGEGPAAVGTVSRGSFTMPHSMASISEKSLAVQGNSVPSA